MDIGANVGLITKQLLTSNIKIKKYLCFEPDKNTFECLEKNLSKNNIISTYNFGLGLKTKSLKLYKNQMNSGDSSFVKKSRIYEICKMNNINSFLKKNYKIINNNSLIYKSDTQGMDEELFIGLQDKYFKKIKITIIEITNHKFIAKNDKKFFSRIKLFNQLYDKKLNKADITLTFKSELTTVVKDKSGKVVEGDSDDLKKQKDVWTFSKLLSNNKPIWFLKTTS